tara:strand:+ start:1438 stop:1608 length:171 start_codon:yes stop_codon:yes gene_type:complete
MIESVKKNNHLITGEFESYIIVEDGITKYVPIDSDNRHYKMIQEWIAAGNTIEEAD